MGQQIEHQASANHPATTSPGQPTPSSRPGGSVEAKAVRVILGNFWVDRDPEVEAMEVASWLRHLKGISAPDMLDAWAAYQRTGPRSESGRLIKPVAEDIRARVMAARAKSPPLRVSAPKASIDRLLPEPERKLVDAETAERICQEYGFTPEHSRRVKRFPKAPTRQAIEDSRSYFAAAEQETRAAVDPDQLRRARESSAISRAALADAHQRRKNIDPDDPGRDIVQPPSDNPGLDGEDPAAVPDGGNSRGGKGLDAAAGPAETRKGGQHSTPDEAGS